MAAVRWRLAQVLKQDPILCQTSTQALKTHPIPTPTPHLEADQLRLQPLQLLGHRGVQDGGARQQLALLLQLAAGGTGGICLKREV